MQKRTDLQKDFYLHKQFIGTTTMGPWDLWISLGNFIDFRGGRNTPHRHSHFETCLVLQGEGDFHHGREVYSLKRGDVFTADPGIIHEIVSSGTDHLTIQFVS